MVKKGEKTYDTPQEGWQSERIQEEKNIVGEYGLKNKKELWKSQSFIRNMRREARKLIAAENEEKKRDIIEKLNSLGMVKEEAELEDILSLDVEDVLDRRLQTVVFKKGLADTIKEARQLITHGKIEVDDERVNVPSYLVKKEEEGDIEGDMDEQ